MPNKVETRPLPAITIMLRAFLSVSLAPSAFQDQYVGHDMYLLLSPHSLYAMCCFSY